MMPAFRQIARVLLFKVVSIVGKQGTLRGDRKGQLCVVVQVQPVGITGAQDVETALPQVFNDASRHIFIAIEAHVQRPKLLVSAFSHQPEPG